MCPLSGHHLYSVTTTAGTLSLWLVNCHWHWPLIGWEVPVFVTIYPAWQHNCERIYYLKLSHLSSSPDSSPASHNYSPHTSQFPRFSLAKKCQDSLSLAEYYPSSPLHQPNNSLFSSVWRQLRRAIYKSLLKFLTASLPHSAPVSGGFIFTAHTLCGPRSR